MLNQLKKHLGIVFFLTVTFYAISQEKNTFTIPDSLVKKDYKYFFTKSRKNYSDTIKARFYLNAYLAKATLEENKIEKSIALSYLSYYAKDKKEVIHLIEKAIEEIEGLEDKKAILVYIIIGGIYHDYFEYETALKYYLRGLYLSQKNNDDYFEHALYNNIAKLKEDIGKHSEALHLYKKCLVYNENIKSSDTIINSLNLAISYRYNKKYDSASYYYDKIIDTVYQKDSILGSILTINEGVNLYYKKKYNKSETLLNNGVSEIIFNTDSQVHYILSQLYLGKIYQTNYQNEQRTKEYYTKIDSLLTTTDVVIPETREVYKFFINYYEKKNDYKKQLSAINKLRKINDLISARNIKVTDELHAKFDTPQLLKSKEILIKKLENKTKSFKTNIIYLIICITILLILFFFQYNRYKLYKKRFEIIVSKIENEKKDIPLNKKTSTSKQLNIDPIIIETTLERLVHFEVNKEFLQSDINIAMVSKKCATNTKYLSKIINTHKGKSFINYINDLRIDYILKELKENIILRRYTIKTISEEAGFNNADSFTKAFKKRTGITPSYYLKNLKSL